MKKNKKILNEFVPRPDKEIICEPLIIKNQAYLSMDTILLILEAAIDYGNNLKIIKSKFEEANRIFRIQMLATGQSNIGGVASDTR